MAFAIASVALGAFVRGYSGFGASMIWVAALSLVYPPAAVVPTVLALEVIASLGLLPRVWRDVAWRQVSLLLVATIATTPLGLWLLSVADERSMRLVIAVAIIVATLALASGFRLRGSPGPRLALTAGAVSGVTNGATAIGGPPAVLLYFSSDAGVNVGRATLIAYFLGTDAAALAMVGAASIFGDGMIAEGFMARTLILTPVTLLGIWLGQFVFERTGGRGYRGAVLWLLGILGVAVLLRTLLVG